jgi:DNA polymerase (family 10)
MNNREIAETFETVADMLAIRGDHFHRVNAYRRAAENIRELNRDLNAIMAEERLTSIPGIGTTLAKKIEEMLTSDRLAFYDRLAEEIPPELVEMLRVEGLGPKRVKQIYDSLGITDLDQLSRVAQEGGLRQLPGLGAKSEARIVAGIEALARHGDSRTPLGVAWPVANLIVDQIRDLAGVERVDVAGSLRRMRESIGDIDILVAADDAEPIMEFFCGMDNVEAVLGRGPTKSSVILLNGVQVDLRVLPVARWGTLLSYFTGSKSHNVRLRELALKQGLSLNEYSFTPKDGQSDILCANEQAVYATLGLPYIPPTLREDKGEIEAALTDELPVLVKVEDIQGDLHMHSTWSDGKMTIREMAKAARRRGLNYIVIADHSASLGIANGLTVDRLRQQAAEIRGLDDEFGPQFRILHGTEMEIRANGELDFPDEILAELDFVIASLHVGLRQSRQQIMERLLGAVQNPHVDMIAHPTGRLIPGRPGADVDMERLIQTAAGTGTILEVNANPQRLDLQANDVRRAIEIGAKIAINSDAHHADHFNFLQFGVATAQRGWASANDVVNTWNASKLMAFVGNKQ